MYVFTSSKNKNMESPNLGPAWVLGCAAIFAVVGIILTLYYIISWVINHVSIQ